MISKIHIENFRNIKKNTFAFSKKTTVIVGDNASGKTNILEAIYLLSTGKSFRARVEGEMVMHSSEIARVQGLADSSREMRKQKKNLSTNTNILPTKLEAVLTRGEITMGNQTQRAPRKKLLVNGVSKRLFNFAGNLKVVLFAPQDLDLVTESPSIRRKYLDFVLSLVDREYLRAVLSYEKGLRQRNKLLFRIREENLARSQLLFWNTLLIKNGNYITKKRREFIDFVNETKDFPAHHTSGKINTSESVQDFSVEYDSSTISESRLEQYARQEVAAAKTLVGPHRDDFMFKLKKNKLARDLSKFGSRGEQRMGVLWIKLAKLKFIKERTNENPTLLLDDIFSELDHEHRDVVMDFVGNQQTIITTADPHFVENFSEVKKIQL